MIQATAEQGDDRTVKTPVITSTTYTYTVVTGYNQVANGTISVPEIHWIETVVTEQVGMEEVKVGTKYYTMDVTLEQDGYYNPQTQTMREYFVEGVDYFNDQIDWNLYGVVDIPSADYTDDLLQDFQPVE